MNPFRPHGDLGPGTRAVSDAAFSRIAGRRGFALVAGFWVVIVALLGARVALFDEIAASRVATFVSTQVASLSSMVLN